jgi:hypothetical protein
MILCNIEIIEHIGVFCSLCNICSILLCLAVCFDTALLSYRALIISSVINKINY